MLLCLHSGSLVLVCTQKNYLSFCRKKCCNDIFLWKSDNQVFSRNSRCNNQLTEMWSVCDSLIVWFLPLLCFFVCVFICFFVCFFAYFFVSLLLYRKLYTENYFTWCLFPAIPELWNGVMYCFVLLTTCIYVYKMIQIFSGQRLILLFSSP